MEIQMFGVQCQSESYFLINVAYPTAAAARMLCLWIHNKRLNTGNVIGLLPLETAQLVKVTMTKFFREPKLLRVTKQDEREISVDQQEEMSKLPKQSLKAWNIYNRRTVRHSGGINIFIKS